jgi:hypothetical protein
VRTQAQSRSGSVDHAPRTVHSAAPTQDPTAARHRMDQQARTSDGRTRTTRPSCLTPAGLTGRDVNISLQLQGIPLDTRPLLELCHTLRSANTSICGHATPSRSSESSYATGTSPSGSHGQSWSSQRPSRRSWGWPAGTPHAATTNPCQSIIRPLRAPESTRSANLACLRTSAHEIDPNRQTSPVR